MRFGVDSGVDSAGRADRADFFGYYVKSNEQSADRRTIHGQIQTRRSVLRAGCLEAILTHHGLICMDADQEWAGCPSAKECPRTDAQGLANVFLALILPLVGATAAIARQDPEPKSGPVAGDCVRLTVEVVWNTSKPDADPSQETNTTREPAVGTEVMLEVTNGRVIEVMNWPPPNWARVGDGGGDPLVSNPTPASKGIWSLGKRGEGRVRARIEAPVDANLVLRGGDQVIGMPLAAVLERPQRTPAQSRLVVTVERLPWDSIVIDLGESARDGVVAPGAVVPVSVGYNIIWPEASEVSVRTNAVLRPLAGGDVLWHDEPREVVPANVAEPASRIWNVRALRAEGTYVLEIRSTWEPATARDGGRLARLIRRRRPSAVATSAVRRVAFTVVDSEVRVGGIALEGSTRDTEVDSVDLSRSRSHRPIAIGRAPLAGPGRAEWPVPAEALIEPSRRDRLRGWFTRNGGEAAKLDAADAGGLAWTALGLKVTRPDRPHRLKVQITGGEPSALGVALVETNSSAPGRVANWRKHRCFASAVGA